MEAKLYGQNKGGTSINGIIKDYYAFARENISAGDLVEYVNGVASKTDYGTSTDTQLINSTYAGLTISAVALDENRVFIAHSKDGSSSYYGKDSYLYGVVCTIDGATITYGTDVKLGGYAYTGAAISAVLLPDGNVFIAHSYNSYYYLCVTICTISGTTVSKVSETILNNASTKYIAQCVSAQLLPNGNVFIAHGQDSNLYATVCTVNGSSVSSGSHIQLSTEKKSGANVSTSLLPNGSVFVAHSCYTSYYLYGMICTVSGTTVSKGTDTSLVSSANAGSTISTCLLPNGNVFIAHSCIDIYHLYGIVCKINGKTITTGTDTVLQDATNSEGSGTISTCLLPNGNVFISHPYDSKYYLYGMVVSINDTTIIVKSDTSLSNSEETGTRTSSLVLKNGAIFTAHCEGYRYDYLNAQMFAINGNDIATNQISIAEYETQIRKVTTGQFDGIAKTSGEGGDDTGHKDLVSIWTKG